MARKIETDEDILDMAGRAVVPMVRCAECPWRRGCPDVCKRGLSAKPTGTARTTRT